MSETVMMQLGDFQFSLSTAAYQEFVRTTAYRWPAQERFGALAALQFTGQGDDTISLSGVVFPEFRGGIHQPQALRDLAALGQPLMMVNGLGEVMGLWVIETVDEKGTVFADAGVARKQDWNIRLRRYGDITDADLAAMETISQAIQLANAPVQAGIVLPAGLAGLGAPGASLGGLASLVTGAAGSAMASMSSALANVRAVAGGITGGVSQISGAMNGAISAASALNVAGLSINSVSSIAGGRSALNNVLSKAASLTSAVTRVEGLTRSAGGLAGIPGPALSALRGAQAAAGRIAGSATSIYQKGQGVLGLLK